ncbi:MAG: protein kinase [Deltaproteobacteria bacterium]|nr:protein kinase [Deltaproteobacteria bacterium]
MLKAGTRVGDYEIERELGEGGMARVYVARHPLLDTRHAIKVLDPELRANAEARQRFLDEARIQAKHLDHPGIVKVTYVIATAEHAALVMELVDGPSLEEGVTTLSKQPDEIRRIMLGVLEAISHAHDKGIIHRDLKPANILLAGRARIPKVTDFGIAKVADEVGRPKKKKSTRAEARMGTLNYSSPEQIRSAKTVTPRSDIFSLGVILYELATGALPFDGANDYEVMDQIIKGRYVRPEQRNPKIDSVIAAVICQAIDPDPQKRFDSCVAMASALRTTRTSTNTTGPARPVSTPPSRVSLLRNPNPERTRARRDPVRDFPVRLVAVGFIGAAAIGIGGFALSLCGRGGSDGAIPAGISGGHTPIGSGITPAAAQIPPTRITASSTLKAMPGYTFTPSNVADGDKTTSWQPDERLQSGPSWIQLDFDNEISVASIAIANGFQVTDKFGDEFLLNSRIKIGRARFSDGTVLLLQFAPDQRDFVRFDVFPPKQTRSIRVIVDQVHPGTARSRSSAQLTDDLAVSEIEIVGSTVAH